jgi:membrane-anchored mycosin MYCP
MAMRWAARRGLGVLIVAIAAAAIGAGARSAGAAAVVASCGSMSGLPSTTTLYTQRPPAQRMLDFERVWPITEGAGVTVAVVDTGVDAAQPFLAGAVLRGYDVVNGGGAADTDCVGHGTFVAGLIAGRRLPGFGFAGVAPQASILPIREADSYADGTAADLAKCIRIAVSMGARVINVSIVTQVPAGVLTSAVQYALAHNVMIVAAAGNDFAQGNVPEYPAGIPGVLAVGAVDANGQRASYSQTGPNVGVVAPGTNLIGPGAGGVGLVSYSGTSFATAYVSGVAALVRAYYPRLTVPGVIRRIEATADHPPGPLPTPGLGWGIVNPYAAVTAVLPGQAHATGTARTRVALLRPPAAGAHWRRAVVGAAIGGSVLAIAILLCCQVVILGRRRGWRPGN